MSTTDTMTMRAATATGLSRKSDEKPARREKRVSAASLTRRP